MAQSDIRYVTLSVQDDQGRPVVSVGVKLEVYEDGWDGLTWVARDPILGKRATKPVRMVRGRSATHAIGLWLALHA